MQGGSLARWKGPCYEPPERTHQRPGIVEDVAHQHAVVVDSRDIGVGSTRNVYHAKRAIGPYKSVPSGCVAIPSHDHAPLIDSGRQRRRRSRDCELLPGAVWMADKPGEVSLSRIGGVTHDGSVLVPAEWKRAQRQRKGAVEPRIGAVGRPDESEEADEIGAGPSN